MTVNIGLIGTRFMGRAHSNAWTSVTQFFDDAQPVCLHTVCARDPAATDAFAIRWGWKHARTAVADIIADDAVTLVDVTSPNHLHAEHAIAALVAGRHVACEKPLAGTLDDARAMAEAAARAAGDGVHTFVWFNYRRCPAVGLARRFVAAGRLGRIYHVRAAYLQDWGGPGTPMLWRFDEGQAGSGAHGDLNAHIIDMARFITGDEIVEVNGAIEKRFIDERPLPDDPNATGRSTVDDCVLFLTTFASGAVGSFEASRLATGNQNRNTIEINGERGAVRFDFERMNELQWWDSTLPPAERGWSRIQCTAAEHPYAAAYWPPAHPIGYEHTFISQAADILAVLRGDEPVMPLPDFADALRTQEVLDAALRSARAGRAVQI